MFGNNTVQSSWANPAQNQQQQQQQQGGSAFGQPNTFGSGGAFGATTGAFGQPQQQQPQANPMFGGLGTAGNSGNSAFGAFGQNTAQQPAANNSVFGAPKPATGFGAFGGGTSTFGTGGAFGATNNNAGTSATGGGLFGTSSTNTNTGGAFGTGLFGQNKAATGFGTTTNTANQENVAPVTTGTSNPAYSVFSEKDTANANIVLQYQTITAMPAYRGTSLEELRFQDYQQGRKTAGAFGQSSFGTAAPAAPSTSLFGAAPAQPASSSLFGGSAFGGTNATTNQTNPTSGAFGNFGQNAASNPPATGTGTGLFGSTFGQPQQQQQQPSAFGAFGQPQQQQQQQPAAGTGGGIFGSSAFGQQNKPATGFGAGNAFGTPSGSAFGTTNTFGQPATQPAAPTSLFGQPQSQQQSTGGGAFGSLGANNTAKPSIFGQPAQPTPPANNSFGLFGGQQQQGQQPQTGGLFGNTGGSLFGQPQQNQASQQQPQQQTGGLFGNTQATTPSTGLFGANTGGSLFGNNQQGQNQQPAQTSNLFGPKPANTTTGTGGLFGGGFGQTGTTTNAAGAAPQTSIFGQPLGQTTNQQQNTGTGAFGSSLFGAPKPTAPGLSTSTSTGGLGGSLFGNTFGQTTGPNTTANTGTQGTLTASIAEPIGSNLPIFSMLPPGPRAVTLEQQPKKKPGFFVDVPTRSPVPRLQLGYTPASSKLRGFATSVSTSSLGGQSNPFAASMSLTSGKPNALTLSRMDGRASVGPESFLGRSSSPSLGSGGRQSVKKLILDKKVDPSDLFSKSGGSTGTRSSPVRVTFSPALSQAAREKEVAREKEAALGAAAAPTAQRQTDSPTPSNRKAPGRFTAASTHNILGDQADSAQGASESAPAPPLQHGDYWVKPDLQALRKTGYEELLAFKDLVVGRIGYGEIHFQAPVDLTGLPKLGALLGELVRFDDKECSVYPDSDEADKPPPGSGLNVAARIILVRCWATDKATREPIKDEKHAMAVKHLKRLKSMKNTHFESFDINEGKWTFTVDHF
ncbi:hypothetical protein BV22DRAFT_1111472 [Leucogyrophana mollusca]|uniref:Uncharacterized protein n=1 Tax=Leucogyrophana mollusca TaxID=85980 RepID=A0ACB8BNE7_9AGAM|nr:hypothetical protein BV22DRAFT_1111472 [Leucogyrophana mollusca]